MEMGLLHVYIFRVLCLLFIFKSQIFFVGFCLEIHKVWGDSFAPCKDDSCSQKVHFAGGPLNTGLCWNSASI